MIFADFNLFKSTEKHFKEHFLHAVALFQNDMSKPMTIEMIDNSNGVIFPFYDPDTGLVFLCGKVISPSLTFTQI